MTRDLESSVVVISLHQNRDAIGNSKSDVCDQGVLVRNANKSYGVGKNRCEIIKGLEMNVKNGTM